jgi:hypothetical protein
LQNQSFDIGLPLVVCSSCSPIHGCAPEAGDRSIITEHQQMVGAYQIEQRSVLSKSRMQPECIRSMDCGSARVEVDIASSFDLRQQLLQSTQRDTIVEQVLQGCLFRPLRRPRHVAPIGKSMHATELGSSIATGRITLIICIWLCNLSKHRTM